MIKLEGFERTGRFFILNIADYMDLVNNNFEDQKIGNKRDKLQLWK